jgi:outer membrane protein
MFCYGESQRGYFESISSGVGQEVKVLLMKRLIAIGTMLLIVFAGGAARAEVKVAYVDVQRVLNECSAGKKAKADFRSQIQRLESRLSKQQSEVQALKDELEKKGMLMKDDERRNLQEEYGRKLRDFERSYKDSKEDLERKDGEITGRIVREIARVIRNVGEKDGYTMVFEKGSILWGGPQIDITDRIITSFNSGASPTVGSVAPQAEPEVKAAASAGAPVTGEFGQDAAQKSTISK